MTYQQMTSESEARNAVRIAKDQGKRAYYMSLSKNVFEVRIWN